MSQEHSSPAADAPVRTPRWMILAAIGAPGAILAVVVGIFGVAAVGADRPPMLTLPVTSLAEAAGNRDAAEVVRRIGAGESLLEPRPVRIPRKIVGVAYLSPLEAAVLSEWTPMIQLLIDANAVRDATTLRRVRCIAERERDRQTIALLAELDHQHRLNCSDVALPDYIRAPVD